MAEDSTQGLQWELGSTLVQLYTSTVVNVYAQRGYQMGEAKTKKYVKTNNPV